MAKPDDFLVISKTYDLVAWSCKTVSKFPRNYRFVLGERIESKLYDLLELLIQAKFSKQRLELLHRANLCLEILRHQMRPEKDLMCIQLNSQ